tara:strand:- start:1533 stop:1694 length:162 start_codon:yes stop_codon:yes gene_type:complete
MNELNIYSNNQKGGDKGRVLSNDEQERIDRLENKIKELTRILLILKKERKGNN